MASDDGCVPAKKNHKGSENEDCETNLKIRFKQGFNMSIGLLEIQYENKRPTLSCEGSLLTRMEPSRAGTNMSAAAYPRPIARWEATVIPSQIVRTRWCLAYEGENIAKNILSTTPSTQPSNVVWIGVNPNWLMISCLWLVN